MTETMKYTDELPELKTSPLRGRSLLAMIILLIPVLGFAFYVFDRISLAAPVETDINSTCNTILPHQSAYSLDTADSEVRYSVVRTGFWNLELQPVAGNNHALTGYIILDLENQANSRLCYFSVDTALSDSGGVVFLNDQIENSEQNLSIRELRGMPENLEKGKSFVFQILTDYQTGTTMTWNVRAELNNDRLEVHADTEIRVGNLDLDTVANPQVKASDRIIISIDLLAFERPLKNIVSDFNTGN